MTRRLSLAGQLLVLQVVIIAAVLVGVAAVTVAQSTRGAEETEGRRALAVAETVANNRAVRAALEAGEVAYVQIAAEQARSVSGSDSVAVADAAGTVIATADPQQMGNPLELGDSTVLTGRSWVGDVDDGERTATGAMVPVLGSTGVLGVVSVTRDDPSLLDGLAAATPNLLTYLGLASALGVVGSLLVSRRVKRQTLGLEPTEIAGLVEHQDAMLHGILEGVVGLDLRGCVTLINDEAVRLMGVPGDTRGRSLTELGVTGDLRDALLGTRLERDRPVAAGGRVLVVNRMPITSRGRPIGSVTTLRDRTELLALRRELHVTRHVTDALRAQAHEFSNRLHTIAGLIELGEPDEAVRYVHRISSSRRAFSTGVAGAVHDPSVAALLVAKASQAEERGVRLTVDPESSLPVVDDLLSDDIATVVGNLLDNAMDAASASPERWVDLTIGLVDGEVDVVVRDSGPGVPRGMEREVFRRGVSTKDAPSGQCGIGLSLVHLVCTRRGGDVVTSSAGGSSFTARLPVAEPVPAS